MTVLDYLKGLDRSGSVLSEDAGRLTIRRPADSGAPEGAWGDYVELNDILRPLQEEIDADWARLDPETTAPLRRTELRLDPGTEDYDTNVRRPYYRLRGAPVTPAQARDIIRRTDGFICDEVKFGAAYHRLPGAATIRRDTVGSINFNQWWFSRNHLPTHYGWSHPDGTVGADAITQKYPNFREFLGELLLWKRAFPYLDLCIAVSLWNEQPPERYGAVSGRARKCYDTERMPDSRFVRELEIGMCTHGDVIEFLNPDAAAARYLDYASRFPAPEPGRFDPEFYERAGCLVCDEAYLLRCVMDFGLDEAAARTLLEAQPDYTWRDSEFRRRCD